MCDHEASRRLGRGGCLRGFCFPLRDDEWLCRALDCLDFLPDQLVVELSRELPRCFPPEKESSGREPADGSTAHDGGRWCILVLHVSTPTQMKIDKLGLILTVVKLNLLSSKQAKRLR